MPLTIEEARTRVPNMSLSELRAEALAHYTAAKAIEDKYPGKPISDPADLTQVKSLLTVTDLLEDALKPQEESEERKHRIMDRVERFSKPAEQHTHPGTEDGGRRGARKSLGSIFTESAEYKAAQGRWVNPNWMTEFIVDAKEAGGDGMSYKDLLQGADSASGGGFVVPQYLPGLTVPGLVREITVLDLIPRAGTTSDTIDYVREDSTGWATSAAMTAEATATTGTTGTKPEAALTFSRQTTTVRTLAHWLPVTNRMLADAPAIRGVIDSRLLLGLQLVLETQTIAATGGGEDFVGLYASGIQVQAKSSDDVQDAIFKAMQKVRVTGLSRPSATAIHPNDYTDVRLARWNIASGVAGDYLMGPPNIAGPSTLWGIPLVQSLGVTEGAAITGDWAMGCMLFDREQPQVRVGLINDQFVRNMQTILAELRAAFVVFRPTSFCQITGV